MTVLLKFLLATHVVTGLLAVIVSYATLLGLLKKELPLRALKRNSVSAVIFYLLSWIAGGYYYWDYYGAAVRDGIKGGAYPWAHTIIMEGKEHVFLFLPFLALAIALTIWGYGDRLSVMPALKKELTVLASVAAILGIIITLSGTLISGAVR